MNTNTKPIKLKTGRYSYRGIIIHKSTRLGFVFTIQHGNPNCTWYYGGIGTLANAIAEIDERIASGDFIINRTGLKQVKW
jgi:hypothetical protein